eukprot:8802990-Ditylum_brightwellii.AAC.1
MHGTILLHMQKDPVTQRLAESSQAGDRSSKERWKQTMWCEKHDHEGKISEDESVAVLKGVSKKTMKKLERAGIKVVRAKTLHRC